MTAEIANIRENPFGNSTDLRLAYFDTPRRNAVARLLTGLYQGEGLFLLIGEDGIGRSTLLRHLGAQVAAIAGVRLLHAGPPVCCAAATGLADLVNGFIAPFNAAGGDSLQLARLLQELAAEGEQMPALLIDDADRLDDAGLKAIATLATLRGGERRLLSVVLAGTPGLPQRLAAVSGAGNSLAATQIIHLMPMSPAEAERMIRHRVRHAGGLDLEEALAPQISELAGQCNGIPQQVLGLCRRVLRFPEVPVARLSLPAAAPGPAARGDGFLASAVASAGVETIAAVTTADPTLTAAGARGDHAAALQSSGRPATPAAAAAQEAFPGLADAAGAPAGLQRPGEIPTGASGHIRYTAASARRVEPARWQDRRRRRRPGWRMALLSATALIGLGVGWTLYDRAHTRPGDSLATREVVPDPGPVAALPTPLAPSSLAPTPLAPSLLPPADSPSARTGVPPALPGASTADTWWRPPPAAEGSSGGAAAPSEPSAARPFEPAPVPSAAQPGQSNTSPRASADPSTAALPSKDQAPAPGEEPRPVAQTPAPAPAPPIPPRPIPKSAAPMAPAQHVDPSARAAKAVTTVELPPPARQGETKPPPSGTHGAALLMEGDEYFSAGDIKAARSSYQQAFDQGSAEAARRLAQTFDPRNVAATSRDASAAEAILWYKDAARRGDRRARSELEGLETWLEDAAASGNAEAQRVLGAWRAPASTDTTEGPAPAQP